MVQGFLYSEPLPPSELSPFLSSERVPDFPFTEVKSTHEVACIAHRVAQAPTTGQAPAAACRNTPGEQRRGGAVLTINRKSGVDQRKGGERRSGSDRRSESDRRRGRRIKKRIPCEIELAGQWQPALVLDVSFNGLFIQTRRSIDPGTQVSVRLRLPSHSETIELRAAVARARRTPARLASVATGGIGLLIRTAPNAYYEFLAGISPEHPKPAPGAPGPSPEPAPPTSRFRVRAHQTGGSRSRTLKVGADSPEEAKQLALRQLGEKWAVLDVELV